MSKFITLFESKAFITGLLATAAAAGAVFGFNVPVALILGVLTPIMITIGAQGWSDAVQMKAKMALEHAVKMHALMHGNTPIEGRPSMTRYSDGTCPPVPQTTSQAGFAKLGVLIVIALTFGPVTLAVSTSGCQTVKPVVTDVVSCAKAEATVVSSGFSIIQIVSEVIAAVQAGPSGIEAAIEKLILKYGGDIVACALDNYPEPGAGSGSAVSASPSVMAKHAALEKFFAGKKIDHSTKH